jgi:hypothetical protein
MKFEALEPAGADRRDIFRLDRRGFMNLVACASTLSLGAGCSTLDRVAPMPPAVADQVTVLGIQNARFWPDTHGDELVREGIEALDRERAAAGLTGSSNRGPNGNLPPANFLALSGGGDDGAFGAGLICGWSDSGKMPNFKLVTGVSTGSMIAPFAFLGGSYINRLRTLYTTIKPDDISEDRGLFGALFGEALPVPADLSLCRRADDCRYCARVRQRPSASDWHDESGRAAARHLEHGCNSGLRSSWSARSHSQGVACFGLDTRCLSAGHDRSRGRGPTVPGNECRWRRRGSDISLPAGYGPAGRFAYIIRNGRLDPDWASVDRRFLKIVGRAISTMIHYSGYNDILRIYATTKRDGVDYNLAYIESDFPDTKHEEFDPAYLRALFAHGYNKGKQGPGWHKAPPILQT